MLFPCERFIQFNIYLNKSPEEIVRTLNVNLLGKNVPVSEIKLKADRMLAVVSKKLQQGKTSEDIAADYEIKDLLEHHFVTPNPHIHAAYGILSWLTVRMEVERGLLLKFSHEEILARIKEITGYCISVQSIQYYAKYFFCADLLNRLQWHWYLTSHDFFNHSQLINDIPYHDLETEKRKAETPEDLAAAQLSFVVKKAYEKLAQKLMEDDDDPDGCAKWFKLYAAAKTQRKAEAPKQISEEDMLLDMGMVDLPDIPVRSVTDFVTKITAPADAPKGPNKDGPGNK